MNFLRQSTASQSRTLGPFVDETDFKTAETGLTIANTDIKLLVNGGASADKNSGGGTHRANGHYGVTFDATDTATVGEMQVSVVVAGALPVFKTFYVLEEAVFDALFAASAPGYVANAPVNVEQFGGTNGTFTSGRPAVQSVQEISTLSGLVFPVGSLLLGTATAGAAGSITLHVGSSSVDDFYTDQVIVITGGTGVGQARLISDHVGSTRVASVTPNWATTPDNTSVYVILAKGQVSWNAAWDAEVQSECADALTAYDAATGTDVSAVETDTQDIQSRLPAALVSGRMDSSVGAMAANTLTASALATDAVTEIATALLTTAMTESYNVDGAAPTLTQAVMLTLQILSESSVSSTTMTTKKLDGSTTAATFTLNSSTAPTSITRAT